MKIKTSITIATAHFVQTAESSSPCRNLHGHDWKIDIEIEGQPKSDGMIVDFRQIKDFFCSNYDHKVLLPKYLIEDISMPSLPVKNIYFFKVGESSYQLPSETCFVLPDSVKVATSELLAIHWAQVLKEKFSVDKVKVTVWEGKESYAEAEA